MNLSGEGLPVIYLKPGEMHISETPSIVVTVLGSCLSVTLFHRRARLAAICHGLFPECGGKKSCNNGCADGFKFVDCSIKRMLKRFDVRHIKRSEIEIKCFGGADMFSVRQETANIVSVGKQNIATAQKMLENEGLMLHSIDVGGNQGRKILFYTHTGEVLLKRLHATDASDVIIAP
jgi:chemotaxis protein CheD